MEVNYGIKSCPEPSGCRSKFEGLKEVAMPRINCYARKTPWWHDEDDSGTYGTTLGENRYKTTMLRQFSPEQTQTSNQLRSAPFLRDTSATTNLSQSIPQ
jgi:hypothetical protein